MIIEPAIDLKNRMCVRLKKGEFDTTHKVAEDPLAVANAFKSAGAEWIHVVDLDGARSGVRINGDIVARIARESDMKIELGGGLRDMVQLDIAAACGVERMVIGSAAVEAPDFVREAVKKYGDRIAVGIDAKDGEVKTSGWEKGSGIDYIEFARTMENIGIKTIVFTDIDTDGMLSGPNYEQLERLKNAVCCNIVASGGVTKIGDVTRLHDMGLYAAIIGKAYYAGEIDLAEAVKEAGKACSQNV